ncbi:alpha/beta fold hydrolase [Nocardia neocaledoniensis]|uniref:alpha/beta fold hydrolase n=1 Tax=Nocardia neocaledoniensis TaxID=236511 RepID=UPI0024541775|nr:alpha/beta fold hydrolase [Nocardia neocaledoniensis]
MTRSVMASDGVRLAIYERGDPAAPTLLCVHGFPDDHSVWDGIAHELEATFHVVSFDVRGSGASDVPPHISAYRLDQLADDIDRIIDAVAPGERVHLVGHDWGSVQAWHVATGAVQHKIASLSSISGPCLDHVPFWIGARLGAGPQGWREVLGMWKSPLYMGFFQIPWLAPLMCRLGVVDAVIKLAERFETGTPPPGRRGDRARENRGGLKIYSANLGPRLLRPQRRHTEVPVQVLAPRGDIFITAASQTDIARWTAAHRIRSVEGGHWAPAFRPAEIAGYIRAFADDQTAAPQTKGPLP